MRLAHNHPEAPFDAQQYNGTLKRFDAIIPRNDDYATTHSAAAAAAARRFAIG